MEKTNCLSKTNELFLKMSVIVSVTMQLENLSSLAQPLIQMNLGSQVG